jgi:hypothetical protein
LTGSREENHARPAARHRLRQLWNAIAITFAALLLAACVSSRDPILGDAKPMLGERLRMALYGLETGGAGKPERATFRWDGSRYVNRGGMKDIASFTLHEFEGRDLIAQSLSRGKDKRFEYAIVRKLADGVFLVFPIDEDDADAATRASACAKTGSASCQADTRDQLLALARAAAAKPRDHGGLAILLAEKKR